MTTEERLNALLGPYNCIVKFGKSAESDFKGYNKEQQEKILALIIRRGKNGPLIKPNGLGEPLLGELYGFAKIKPKKMGIRIVYRPIEQSKYVRMEIIAIGPRDRDKVYDIAVRRVIQFKEEMAELHEFIDMSNPKE